MNYRQVHLDFHTSEKIENIGKNFNKQDFQKALLNGHINSITLFAKCHHGWSYHSTKVNKMHPGLDFDLLSEQIRAAHEIGVKTPVYLSAGHDEKFAVEHKDWCVRNKDNSTTWSPDFDTPGYHKICMNTPFFDMFLEQIEEVVKNYDADGLFFDVCCVQPCYCKTCTEQLIKEGKNPENEEDVIELAERVYKKYVDGIRKAVDAIKPGLPIFHNCGHVRRGRRDLIFANSHLELESLPTGGWGYDHFPVSASYARTVGIDYLGMTGKFHTSWGEFGGFKHPNALKYEVCLSLANGAACSIGDQLHPSGTIDRATYEMIGQAYKDVEEKESFVKDAKCIADIGVLGKEATDNYYNGKDFSTTVSTQVSASEKGCVRILLEGNYLFNYIDEKEDFENYKLIILPDDIILDDFLTSKLTSFANKGGKIIASGKSGTDKNGTFKLDFGCEFAGEAEFRPSYLRTEFELKSLKKSAYVIYSQGYNVNNITGEVIAIRENPYFNRTLEHFSSHQHTPNNPENKNPAIIKTSTGVYIGWDIFEEYATHGSITIKEAVCGIIDSVLGNKSVKTNLPAQGVVSLMEKEESKIVHLLYASPVKRGEGIEIIEDIIPIYNTEVSVRCEKNAKRVYLAPQDTDIEFQQDNGYVTFKVDRFECHQMIVIE